MASACEQSAGQRAMRNTNTKLRVKSAARRAVYNVKNIYQKTRATFHVVTERAQGRENAIVSLPYLGSAVKCWLRTSYKLVTNYKGRH